MHERESSEQAFDEAMAIQRAALDGAAQKAAEHGTNEFAAAPDRADYARANTFIDTLMHQGEQGVSRMENMAEEMQVIHELGQEQGEHVLGLWKAMTMERKRHFDEVATQAKARFAGRDMKAPEVVAEASAFLMEHMFPMYEEMVDKVRRSPTLRPLFPSEAERHHLDTFLDEWLQRIRQRLGAATYIEKQKPAF